VSQPAGGRITVEAAAVELDVAVKGLPVVVNVVVTGKTAAGKAVKEAYADFYGGPGVENLDLITVGRSIRLPARPNRSSISSPTGSSWPWKTRPRSSSPVASGRTFRAWTSLKAVGDVKVVDGWYKASTCRTASLRSPRPTGRCWAAMCW